MAESLRMFRVVFPGGDPQIGMVEADLDGLKSFKEAPGERLAETWREVAENWRETGQKLAERWREAGEGVA